MHLRPYQHEAVEAVYQHLRTRDDNPCVVIPTGGGKTPVMASICRDAVGLWNGRVLVLAHVKELLEQTAGTLQSMALDVGIYSAGLGRRDTDHPIIVAGIQSVYRRACDLGRFDLIMIDEAHLIPPDGEGMYRTFLADAQIINPHVRLIGLTATPYRMSTGMICSPENLLNHICYEVGVRELIAQGYLCPLVTKAGKDKADFDRLHIRGGEFIADEVEALMDDDLLVESACREIIELTQDRHSVLIFASGIQHALHIQQVIEEMGHECGFVCGNTLPNVRAEILKRFKEGSLKYLVNINVLTTGFDAPNIDCIALLRPTNSPGLYYQMVGRGFRQDPSKENCLVLDFGGNVVRHGPVDAIKVASRVSSGTGEAPAKECPDCHSVIAAGYATCPDCGYEFPAPERQKHDATADDTDILSGRIIDTEYDVRDITYSVHSKRDAPPDAPKTMRVDYHIGIWKKVSEFICFEHTGFPLRKAKEWWRLRSLETVPETAERAVEIAEKGGLAYAKRITVRSIVGEKYDRIIKYELGPIPGPTQEKEADSGFDFDDEEVPF